MPFKKKSLRMAASLTLLGLTLPGAAQTPQPILDTYISQTVGESETLYSSTIGQWAKRYPGEVVEDLADKSNEYNSANTYNLSPRQQQDRKLQGRWCLRSLAEIDLAGGIRVRRIALFYQPLVAQMYGEPLPPLPTETGDDLRKDGCRLVRILHEFEHVPDPQKLAETIAKQMPGKRVEEPGRFIQYEPDTYWKPICSFEKFGQPIFYHHLFIHDPQLPTNGDPAAVLLAWDWGTLKYGSAGTKTIDPEAGQPWLPLRAAMLARLPESPTLEMLSFLAPQLGDRNLQPPFYCVKTLVPAMRTWLDLAAKSPPEKQAAAILLADSVLGRLGDCEEFAFDTNAYMSPEDRKKEEQDHETLENYLQEAGIKTETTHLGFEYYSGNLLEKVLKLEPEGAVNELGRMAMLDARCQWNFSAGAVDCTMIISEGESFLTVFPDDEWTPSVHLILAEAYSLTAANPEETYSATPQPNKTEWENRALAHYRAWYGKSKNEQARALVWQEIWALQAGLGPWLMLPSQLQQ
jgi:hypothetical protein